MSANEMLPRSEHEEFSRRVEAENSKIAEQLKTYREESTRRLDMLEDSHSCMIEMNGNMHKMLTEMKYMREDNHEMREDMHEMRTSLGKINVEKIESRLSEHDQQLEDHEKRLRDQELKPQDSDDHEQRLRALEGKPGKNWEKIVGAIIAGIATFVVGWMLHGGVS